jgi:N4-gp56 family major capsid protein
MANEVTTAAGSAGELVPTIVSELIVDAAYAASVAREHCRIDSLTGRPGKTLDVPLWPKLAATALTEATDPGNTAINTTKITVTAAEVGLVIEISDLLEASDVVAGLGDFARQCGMAVAEKIDTDVTALFDGFTGNVSGTTGTDFTEAKLLDAIFKLEEDNAPRPYVGVLHPRQTHALRKELAASTGVIHAPGGQDEFATYVTQAGFFGTLFNVPLFATTTVKTINAAVDYNGAMLADRAAIEFLEKWNVRTEMWRDIKKRSTAIAINTAYGVSELVDNYGCALVSKVAL